MPTLHVVVPVYNEERTLADCLERLLDVALPAGWDLAVVLVDDSSAPAARDAAVALVRDHAVAGRPIALLHHPENRGKGAAIRTGFGHVLAGLDAEPQRRRDIVAIQDADLEYDPRDLVALMRPIVEGHADAVVGNRWGARWTATRPAAGLRRRVHRLGNGALTLASNLLTGLRLRDMECCYKLMPVELLRRVLPQLSEDRFGVEPQVVAVLARLGARVVEVDVAYDPRGIKDGKKIGVRDGVRALWVIARERFTRAPHVRPRSPGPISP